MTKKYKNSASSPFADMMGILVFAIALACAAGVGTLAWMKFIKKENQETNIVEAQTCPDCPKKNQPSKASLPSNKLYKPKASDFIGLWEADIGGNKATLLFMNDIFRITYSKDPQGRYRQYSSGTYSYDENQGILNLTPATDIAQPREIPGVYHEVLTMRPFDIVTLKEKKRDEIFWTPSQDQLETKRMHPFFFYDGANELPVIKWSKKQLKANESEQ